jgi:hypothetical protein
MAKLKLQYNTYYGASSISNPTRINTDNNQYAQMTLSTTVRRQQITYKLTANQLPDNYVINSITMYVRLRASGSNVQFRTPFLAIAPATSQQASGTNVATLISANTTIATTAANWTWESNNIERDMQSLLGNGLAWVMGFYRSSSTRYIYVEYAYCEIDYTELPTIPVSPLNLYKGISPISLLYKGVKPIRSLYKGRQKIFDLGAAPPPPPADPSKYVIFLLDEGYNYNISSSELANMTPATIGYDPVWGTVPYEQIVALGIDACGVDYQNRISYINILKDSLQTVGFTGIITAFSSHDMATINSANTLAANLIATNIPVLGTNWTDGYDTTLTQIQTIVNNNLNVGGLVILTSFGNWNTLGPQVKTWLASIGKEPITVNGFCQKFGITSIPARSTAYPNLGDLIPQAVTFDPADIIVTMYPGDIVSDYPAILNVPFSPAIDEQLDNNLYSSFISKKYNPLSFAKTSYSASSILNIYNDITTKYQKQCLGFMLDGDTLSDAQTLYNTVQSLSVDNKNVFFADNICFDSTSSNSTILTAFSRAKDMGNGFVCFYDYGEWRSSSDFTGQATSAGVNLFSLELFMEKYHIMEFKTPTGPLSRITPADCVFL